MNVNVIATPGHGEPVVPTKVAKTVNVEVIGAPLVLVAVKAGIAPVPIVGNAPMSGTGTVLDHVMVAPGILLPRFNEGTLVPAQTV